MDKDKITGPTLPLCYHVVGGDAHGGARIDLDLADRSGAAFLGRHRAFHRPRTVVFFILRRTLNREDPFFHDEVKRRLVVIR